MEKQIYALKSVALVCYPESLPVGGVMLIIKTLPVERFAYILHDKDMLPDGTPKKTHIHVLLWFNKYVNTRSLLKKFGLSPEFCPQTIKCKEKMERYLLHLDDEKKHQYFMSEVIANYDINWEEGSYVSKETKNLIEFQKIIKTIDLAFFSCNGNLCFDKIINDLVHQRLLETFRKNYLIFRDYIKAKKEGDMEANYLIKRITTKK